jgi:hypothetical protein
MLAAHPEMSPLPTPRDVEQTPMPIPPSDTRPPPVAATTSRGLLKGSRSKGELLNPMSTNRVDIDGTEKLGLGLPCDVLSFFLFLLMAPHMPAQFLSDRRERK